MKKTELFIENAHINIIFFDSEGLPECDIVSMTPHTHGYAELFAVLEGEVILDGKLLIQKNGVALVPSNIYHHKTSESENAVYRTVGISVTKTSYKHSSDVYSKLIRLLEQDKIVNLPDRHELCEAVLNINENDISSIIYLVSLFVKEGNGKNAVAHTSKLDIDIIYKLELIIDTEFMNELTLENVSKRLCISSRQLSRIVNKRYGASFQRTVIKKKIETAKEMLKNTNRSVGEIAGDVGFKSETSMFMQFRRFEGVTPGEYRKQNR